MQKLVANFVVFVKSKLPHLTSFKKFQMWKYLYLTIDRKRGLFLIFSISGLVVSILVIIGRIFDPSTAIWIVPVSLIFYGASVLSIKRQLSASTEFQIEDRKNDRDLYAQIHRLSGVILLKPESPPAATEAPPAAVVRYEKVDRMLRSNQRVELRVDKDKTIRILNHLKNKPRLWTDVIRCKTHESIAGEKLFFNGKLLQMTSDLSSASTSVGISQADYYTFYITCMFFSYRLTRIRSRSFGETLKDVFSEAGGQWELSSLEDPRHAYVVGVSVLAITSDGFLVIWEQTDRAQSSVGRLVPSGSGSVDWKDYHAGDDLSSLITRAMKREFSEESIGNPFDSYSENELFDGIRILGYFRWVNKCGSPEFVGLCKLRISSEKLVPDFEEVRTDMMVAGGTEFTPKYKMGCRDQALKSIEELRRHPGISVPLWVSLECLKEVLEHPTERNVAAGLLGWE